MIYAQPVTIRPVGRPLPAIPVKRPAIPYGPAKPIPLPPSFGVPSPVSIYPGTFNRPPPNFVGSYPGFKKPGLSSFVSKPIYEHGSDIELDYEDKLIDKKQVVLHQSKPSNVQQHVHHHYHHGDANAATSGSSAIIPPQSLGLNNYGYGNGGTYGATFNDFDDYKKTFKIQGSTTNNNPLLSTSEKGYADRYPIYEKPKKDSIFSGNINQHGKQFGLNGQLVSNSQFLGNVDSNDYQFHNGDNSFGSSSLKYDDCVCVPYEQCATINHVGRKDDLYLAIDPRNLDKDIEAETVVITDGNGTMSVVRIPKGINETEQTEEAKNKQAGKPVDESVTKRNRRDVAEHITKDNKKEEIQEVSRLRLFFLLFLHDSNK